MYPGGGANFAVDCSSCYFDWMETKDYQLPTPLIIASADWLGGEPCFTGRRVPVKALFDFLKEGRSLDEFLDAYPSVSKAHAVAVIDMANRAAVAVPAAAE